MQKNNNNNCTIFDFKSMFLLSKIFSFLSMATKHVVMAYFAEKRKKTEIPIFDKKPLTHPFGKMQNFRLF